MALQWPLETVFPDDAIESWHHPGSNVVLDFHGDPLKADLVVFSDGNHHMALLPALQAFRRAHPRVTEIFYASTPPDPILRLLKTGAIRLGNLTLSVRPHVFISPPHLLEALRSGGYLGAHRFLAQSRGSVLLISRHNPKKIETLADLTREDVRLFISNPDTETVSYTGYRKTLEGLAALQGLNADHFSRAVFGPSAVLGRCIHHREAPEAVAGGRADAAVVYYHLALRYITLFPDDFDLLPLGGTRTRPEPPPENRIAKIHMGVVGDGGRWGERLVDFMAGDRVAGIYGQHGLHHGRDRHPAR